MRRVLATIAITTLLLTFAAGPAWARGANQDRLERAGWDCSIVIMGEPHCVAPNASWGQRLAAGAPSIPVLVFGSDGSFRGTELLIRADLYAGQPCPQDEVLDLTEAIPYFACHHYTQ